MLTTILLPTSLINSLPMKKVFAILIILTSFTACSKKDETPAVPLVKQIVLTLPYITVEKNNTYDDKRRLASVGAANHIVTYRAGGFEIVLPYDNGDKLITDVNLENGRISTVLSYPSEIERYNSTFSYDTKGRLIKIIQTRTFNGQIIDTFEYTYSWDDNDNLIAATIPDNQGGSVKTTYSGFSADNVNTLGGKNFGFDYFGTAGYPSNYTPDHNGGPGNTFPGIYAGKILPSVISSLGATTNVIYHKNSQGYIDRIENVNANPADNGVIDIVYE
jgi:YD repeat-containing protein